MTPKDDLRLYALVRNDLESMTAEKMAAQAMHAQRAATLDLMETEAWSATEANRYLAWQQQSGFGFGSTIILRGAMPQLLEIHENLRVMGAPAGVVTNESYPIRDGDVTHAINLQTCVWAFGAKQEFNLLFNRLSLS